MVLVTLLAAACGRLGTPQAGPTPTPSASGPSASSGPCDPSNLQLRGNGAFPVPPQGVLSTFAFANTGPAPCTLAGFPTIGVIYPNSQMPALSQTDAADGGGIYGPESTGPITLGPGDLAGFYVVVETNTSDLPDCAPVGETLRAVPPGASRPQALSLPNSQLNYCLGDQVSVSPVHLGDAWPSPPP